MDEREIAEFLRGQPGFFDRHPDLLESILVPHPHGDRAIPLTERQVLGLREKIRSLEGRLAELVGNASDNDAIGEKVHRLALALLATRDFAGCAQTLYLHLREDFAVPHVAMRIWGRTPPPGAAEGDAVAEALRLEVDRLAGPVCSPASSSPFLDWFDGAREHVRSLALVPLGQTRAFGLLVLGSEDAQRFYPEMGTLFLRRIGELAAAAVLSRL